MKKILLILSLAMVLLALARSATLAAGGKIRFGNLAIVPTMGVAEVHDDNIYLDSKGKESDWITHYKPGLMLDYTIEGRGKLLFGYSGDYAYYSAKKDNDWKKHDLLLDLDYQAPGGLIVKIKNKLENAEYPYGDKQEYKNGIQSEAWREDLNTAFGYKFSDRFKLLGYYNYYRQDYKNHSGDAVSTYTNNSFYYGGGAYNNQYYYTGSGDFRQDYASNEVGLGFETKVTHKTWAFLRYYNGSQQYFTHRYGVTGSNDASYDWQRVATGLDWDNGGRYIGEVNFGYQWNNHNNSRDPNGIHYKDENNWVAETRFAFKQVEGRTFFFTANRHIYQLDSATSAYYTSTSFGIGVEQKIKSKFFLQLAYMYEKNKFKSEGENLYFNSSRRDDNLNRIRAGLKYTITEWLTAGVEYTYWKNHSSESLTGFADNLFSISLDFKPAEYH